MPPSEKYLSRYEADVERNNNEKNAFNAARINIYGAVVCFRLGQNLRQNTAQAR
jgi:hypothetical protein